jgi:hypothetical protein
MIFGNEAPKFIYNPAVINQTVLLNYIQVITDKPEPEEIIHQSIFTGHREFIILGHYYIYVCKLHLYKYTTAVDGLTPQEKYDEIKQFEGNVVRFFRHSDGNYLKDSTGAEVEMFLQSIDESYYKTPDYKDLLLLKFKSTKYVDLTQGLGA